MVNVEREPADCPACEYPLSEHIGGEPCIQSPPSKIRGLYDLPIFGRFWAEDAKQVER